MTTYSDEKILGAAKHLASSRRGRHALAVIHNWMNLGGNGLDHVNQDAVNLLLAAGWNGKSGTMMAAIEEVMQTDEAGT